MRVLTDPAETGAVTLALPQDVQAEAFDWPADLFAYGCGQWPGPFRNPKPSREPSHHPRRPPAADHLRRRRDVLRSEGRAPAAGRGDRHPGRGDPGRERCAALEPPAGGGRGRRDRLRAANALAAEADVILGIGTRYSDFTTASRTAFGNPAVRFVNLNVAAFDAGKQAGTAVVADARRGLEALAAALDGYHVETGYTARFQRLTADWEAVTTGPPSRARAAARADGSHRRGQRDHRPARRGGLGGRQPAR